MLFDSSRHESLQLQAWDEARVRETIAQIVASTEAAFSPESLWRVHPQDLEAGEDPDQPSPSLYYGAAGVAWALHHLQDVGAVRLQRDYRGLADELLQRTRGFLGAQFESGRASWLMGETPILMLAHAAQPSPALEDRLAALIAGNVDHPARELLWGAPGTLLAALFLHERTGDGRWAAHFRQTASHLASQLERSEEFGCLHWTQVLYGKHSSYLGAGHGFAGVASPLIRGRHLLDAAEGETWMDTLADTVERTAVHEGAGVNWRAWLTSPPGRPMLMQWCHGAPGFVICLGSHPGPRLDALLCAAGEAIWAAGPLIKGSNLCHGTGGNGYAFLKLWQRSGDERWLQRARAFAMHGLQQTVAAEARYGQLRHSLWTGDPGFAIYLWHCLQGSAEFPTLDRFDAPRA